MIKKAKVISNLDPETRERLRVAINGIHDFDENTSTKNGVWAEHCKPFKHSSGGLPEEGDTVWVWHDGKITLWLGLVILTNITDIDYRKDYVSDDAITRTSIYD